MNKIKKKLTGHTYTQFPILCRANDSQETKAQHTDARRHPSYTTGQRLERSDLQGQLADIVLTQESVQSQNI